MTFFQLAVLALLALNAWVMYRLAHRLAIVTLTGLFAIAQWQNPLRARWFEEAHEKLSSLDPDDKRYVDISARLAEMDPECSAGRKHLIAEAFETYRECGRIPDKYRDLDKRQTVS